MKGALMQFQVMTCDTFILQYSAENTFSIHLFMSATWSRWRELRLRDHLNDWKGPWMMGISCQEQWQIAVRLLRGGVK